MDRRWGTAEGEESAASDDFLQRRGNDGGDQEGEEEDVEVGRFRFLQNGDSGFPWSFFTQLGITKHNS